jgi:phosphatidylcholine synthase
LQEKGARDTSSRQRPGGGIGLEPVKKRRRSPLHVMAYGVHVFTALGAALGFLALEAVIRGDLTLAFWWLGVAMVVDAADGPMARRLNVTETASRYDGATLDLVVDFITYVFVPAAMLFRPEVMAQPWGIVGGLVITLGSALYFADVTMKTDDWWFRGFPAVWNGVVFYLVVFAPPTIVSMAIILVLAALMFLPVIFVHPFRVKSWRRITMVVLAAWTVAVVAALLQKLQPALWVKAVLLLSAFYFIFLGWLRSRRLPWAKPKPPA